ncbi:predicted protein [Nematostella vectensis]|uniref:Major facilitator superfamily (MFS) profile domain-containing protein n=1 Tax=Nematostella vectensis TaxID=45351 RepID=A7S1C3_NEMVE|nr:predicted protein [Nematostella vectensis]|eukprot:XP_001634546.1 predicted protein [Nematostella vectensis]
MAVYRVDSGRSWGVCCCATIANGLVHSVVLSFGVILPVLIKEFGISKEQTALVGALAYGVGCFTGLLAARLCDRFGLQRTHIFGTLTCAVALLSSSWATSNAILYFTYSVLFGLGMSSVFMPCFLAVAKYFRRHRCSAVGMVTAGPAAGVLVMGPSLQALVNAVGWRHAYRILSVVFVLSCALSWPFREEAPDNETHDAMVHDKEGKNREQPANRKCRPDFTVCRIPAFTIGLFSMCFAGIGHFSPPIHLVRISMTSTKTFKLSVVR